MKQKPLRILQILRSPIGGLYRHVVDVAREMAQRGHHIGLVMDSSLSDRQTEERLAMLRPSLALGVHKFPMPRVLGFADLTTPLRIRRLAKSLNIDVIHGHGAKGGLNARLARIGQPNRVAIYTPHGGVLHFSPDTAKGKVFRLLETMLLRQTDAIIFESRFASNSYMGQITTPNCPAPVIHNGLAPNEFVSVPLHRNASDFVFVGELRPLKGIFYLLEALVSVKAKDGRPASLIVAGDGPSREKLKEYVLKLGLKGRVQLVGVQPITRMLGLGRCMVVPSLAESLPYVVLEAAAASTPLIATRVGGIGEIFGPTAASLIQPADTAALSGAMQDFMDDMAGAKKQAAARFKFVRDTFSLKLMVDAIEEQYGQALTRR